MKQEKEKKEEEEEYLRNLNIKLHYITSNVL